MFEFKEICCPVCKETKAKVLGSRGGEAHHDNAGMKTLIVRCGNCSHLYPNPMPVPTVNLDELYVDTENYFKGHEIEQKKIRCLEMLRDFEKRVGKKGKILDIGSGMGEFLWAAKEAGWQYEGIDPSSEFIEFAKKNLGVDSKLGTLEDFDFPDNSFDVVVLSSLIEHLPNPKETLEEVWRILRDRGLLWFDAPNEDSLYTRMGNMYQRIQGRDWVISLAPTFPPYHIQGFSPKSLRFLLNDLGFEIEKMSIRGTVWEFTGDNSFRKNVEYLTARCINWIGNRVGMGFYMSVWARKPNNS